METKKTNEYLIPVVVCIEMNPEGVLCGSPDIEVGDGGDVFDDE